MEKSLLNCEKLAKRFFPKMILLEYMIIFGFITFLGLTIYSQGMFHVKPSEQKQEQTHQIERIETSFAWD